MYTANGTYKKAQYFFGDVLEKTGIAEKKRGNAYTFGFNGKENDNEVKGEGNSLDFGARMYDPRLGRWMSVDPLEKLYASFSTYNFAVNSPILAVDNDGRSFKIYYQDGVKSNGTPKIRAVRVRSMADLDKAVERSNNNAFVANFVESIKYLREDKADNGEIERVITDRTKISVYESKSITTGSYFDDTKRNALYYNPHAGLEFQKNGEKMFSSPAIVLMHELGHVIRKLFFGVKPTNINEPGSIQQKEIEEQTVTEVYEKTAASIKNEKYRDKYEDGKYVEMDSPTTTEPKSSHNDEDKK